MKLTNTEKKRVEDVLDIVATLHRVNHTDIVVETVINRLTGLFVQTPLQLGREDPINLWKDFTGEVIDDNLYKALHFSSGGIGVEVLFYRKNYLRPLSQKNGEYTWVSTCDATVRVTAPDLYVEYKISSEPGSIREQLDKLTGALERLTTISTWPSISLPEGPEWMFSSPGRTADLSCQGLSHRSSASSASSTG
jgi:hypothetical protein